MQGIFAEAYQASLGRTGAQALKGQKAIEELNKAMEAGNVYSAKVLPYVAEIAKRLAEPGLAEARGASFAEQARFANQTSRGWTNFRQGGGEEGLAYFWRMMQEMGSWFENNGARLGGYFQVFTSWLNVFRVGVKEFYDFAIGGESNDLTQIFKENWGLDLIDVRERLVSIFSTFKDLTWKLLESLGFVKDGSLMQGLSDKFGVFVQDLEKIFAQVQQMMQGIARFMNIWNESQQGSIIDRITAVPKLAGAAADIISGAGGATVQAFNANANLMLGSGSPTLSGGVATRNFDPTSLNQIPVFTPQMYTSGMQQNLPGMVNHVQSGTVVIKVEVDGSNNLVDGQDLESKIARALNSTFNKTSVDAANY